MIDDRELDRRFSHHPPASEAVADSHAAWRGECKELARYACERLPEGRELALVLTHLEDALMWGNAAIARHQEE